MVSLILILDLVPYKHHLHHLLTCFITGQPCKNTAMTAKIIIERTGQRLRETYVYDSPFTAEEGNQHSNLTGWRLQAIMPYCIFTESWIMELILKYKGKTSSLNCIIIWMVITLLLTIDCHKVKRNLKITLFLQVGIRLMQSDWAIYWAWVWEASWQSLFCPTENWLQCLYLGSVRFWSQQEIDLNLHPL